MTCLDRVIDRTAVVILAAGKGSRMGSAEIPKVCFEIDGQPAISRAVATFKAKGFKAFYIVVGFQAERVMQTLSPDHPDVHYIYQAPQLGTGHAARLAADCLAAHHHDGYVLITMGDKYMEAAALDLLLEGAIKSSSDFALLTLPRTAKTDLSGGRVMTAADGRVMAIIEKMDIARLALADALRQRLARNGRPSSATIRSLIDAAIPNRRKQDAAVPDLLRLAGTGGDPLRKELLAILDRDAYRLTIDGKSFTAKAVERECKVVNPSLYLLKAAPFFEGVRHLKNHNAQNEYYLTDIVHHLNQSRMKDGSPRYRITTVKCPDANLLQGFNSPEELLAIADYVTRSKRTTSMTEPPLSPRLGANRYTSIARWLSRLECNARGLKQWMHGIYGDNPDLHARKRQALMRILRCHGRAFGLDDKVVIVRAPGRVNLMGRHVDHRGGFTNCLAIHKETIAVAGLRSDDRVIAHNVDSRVFKPVNFGIGDQVGRFDWGDWLEFVNSPWVRQLLHGTQGDWGNYIKAAVLRLQHQFQGLKIRGINMTVLGDVPMAAGLSSSSALVVATLQAAIALNGFDLDTRQFIDLCGEGEWFVGSRGGSGDHAAITIGQKNTIVNVGFLPFRIEDSVAAPDGYQAVIVNSHQKATKSAEAKHIFNARICGYTAGLELLKARCPEIASRVEHLRDISPAALACRPSDIYGFLKRIPQAITRSEMRESLPPDLRERLSELYATHRDPGSYALRGILIFGIAEILRSRLCVNMLRRGDMAGFGRLMSISHDGDRVCRRDETGRYRPVGDWYSDDHIDALCFSLHSEDPRRVEAAQLHNQPGWYACSTPEIDRIVDIANGVDGVAGAQIAGAGLGGCVIIWTRKTAVKAVERALIDQYYRPHKLKPEIIPCITVEGAGLVA